MTLMNTFRKAKAMTESELRIGALFAAEEYSLATEIAGATERHLNIEAGYIDYVIVEGTRNGVRFEVRFCFADDPHGWVELHGWRERDGKHSERLLSPAQLQRWQAQSNIA